jgi:uncharacterized protein with GYD domain
MSYYLFQATYTREAIATMVQNPQDRAQAVRAVIEKAGGRVEGFWFAFGEYDTVEIIELRDNVDAVAFSMAVSAGGALKAIKTTPLLTMDQAVAAMKKASMFGYRPPSQS